MSCRFLAIITFLTISVSVFGQDFKTYNYFKHDTISLDLDLFLPETDYITPLVIYVHGGGFSGGDRTGGHNLARHLVSKGIACASISYTLYMKGRNFGCGGVTSEKVKAMQIAASQLWNATDFLMDMSEEIRIDTTKIFIAGSSAGAETVLHAGFWDRSQMQLFEQKLPKSFQYRGIIGGAGAIMDLNLITNEKLVPVMMFHGDADPTVPYGTAAHHYCPPNATGWLMFFGSSSIADHVVGLGGSSQLTTFVGGKHSFAGAYFYQDQHYVYEFIQDVLEGRHFVEYYKVFPKGE